MKMKNLHKMATDGWFRVFKQINTVLYENDVKDCMKKTIEVWNYLYNNNVNFNDDTIKDVCRMY